MCRPGKFGHAAHFTLRGGCQKADGSYQQPLVALVCNFGGSSGDPMDAPLGHLQVCCWLPCMLIWCHLYLLSIVKHCM